MKIPFIDVEVTEPLMQSAKARARAVLPRHWYSLRFVTTVEYFGEKRWIGLGLGLGLGRFGLRRIWR